MGFLLRLSAAIDAVNGRVGRGIRLLTLVMVVVTTADVFMRYLLNTSFVFVQELEWHLFAVLFLLAAGYTHLKGDHVRVDLVYARLPPRRQARVDVIGSVLLLFPTCFLLIATSIPFVQASIGVLEGSPDPGGIPGRYLLKLAIPVGFSLLAVQGVSELIKSVVTLRKDETAP